MSGLLLLVITTCLVDKRSNRKIGNLNEEILQAFPEFLGFSRRF